MVPRMQRGPQVAVGGRTCPQAAAQGLPVVPSQRMGEVEACPGVASQWAAVRRVACPWVGGHRKRQVEEELPEL